MKSFVPHCLFLVALVKAEPELKINKNAYCWAVTFKWKLPARDLSAYCNQQEGLVWPTEAFIFLSLECVMEISKLDVSYFKIPIYLIY